MKIAISSEGKDENSKVSQMSGRAPYYLIFENKKLIKTIKNPFRMGGGGAGFGVAEMLSEENVNLVISGKFGGNMVSTLETKGIKSKELSGIMVKEALEKAE
ncbi:MAG: hypothetical protein DRP06_00600 [Candidatus Aenigmatarchaeota archaeon]|nr:MAG: hypothetical protein DRP06_00600 [Candidatus Aenigmarchaeota archaeon]